MWLTNQSERSMSVIIALQPRKMVFQPLIDVIDLAVEMGHFQLGFEVYFVIKVGLQAVFR
jgi:hypothetical protein